MRKLPLVLLPLLFLLCACDASRLTTLPEFSHPYAGSYACEELSLGGRDLRGEFGRLELELKQDGGFLLFYETAVGEGSAEGRYAVSAAGDEIALTFSYGGREGTRTYPYRGGKILIDENLGGRLLHAVFGSP